MNRTMTITVEPDWKKDLRHAAVLVQQGIETGQYQGEYLNFATPATFFSHLTTNRWHILTCLLDSGTLGVRELARRVGRDVKRVHVDAQALVQLGLLEKTARGALRCPFSRIDIDMALVPRSSLPGTAEPRVVPPAPHNEALAVPAAPPMRRRAARPLTTSMR